jgi:hypothetical protein
VDGKLGSKGAETTLNQIGNYVERPAKCSGDNFGSVGGAD